MESVLSRVTVIGDGAMGTLCALLAAGRGSAVRLWGRSRERMEALRRRRENARYLSGHPFPDNLEPVHDERYALDRPDLVISAVPCQYMRSIWNRLRDALPDGVPVVSVSKGIEIDTLATPTQILRQCVPGRPVACLSGPCIAPEVARRLPTSVVVAADADDLARRIQDGLSTEFFRVYTSDDLVGVETAGAVKNVIALAAGICDGIGLGANAKASLVTRGLVEITRLGVAMGARPDTFAGLAGVGDLITTCHAKVGRNRSAGERIGRGESAEDVVASTPSVIEGIPTTRAVLALAQRYGVELPIVSGVASVLFDGVSPSEAIRALMTRPLRREGVW